MTQNYSELLLRTTQNYSELLRITQLDDEDENVDSTRRISEKDQACEPDRNESGPSPTEKAKRDGT